MCVHHFIVVLKVCSGRLGFGKQIFCIPLIRLQFKVILWETLGDAQNNGPVKLKLRIMMKETSRFL